MRSSGGERREVSQGFFVQTGRVALAWRKEGSPGRDGCRRCSHVNPDQERSHAAVGLTTPAPDEGLGGA